MNINKINWVERFAIGDLLYEVSQMYIKDETDIVPLHLPFVYIGISRIGEHFSEDEKRECQYNKFMINDKTGLFTVVSHCFHPDKRAIKSFRLSKHDTRFNDVTVLDQKINEQHKFVPLTAGDFVGLMMLTNYYFIGEQWHWGKIPESRINRFVKRSTFWTYETN